MLQTEILLVSPFKYTVAFFPTLSGFSNLELSLRSNQLSFFLNSCFSLLFLAQRQFPEKLKSCTWLSALSEAVVKRPFLRLPLATVATAIIVIIAMFNLVMLSLSVTAINVTNTLFSLVSHVV